MKIINYISEYIYTVYFVLLILFSGFISLFFETDRAYIYGQYKDYLISFFAGLLYIFLALFLILIKYLYSYLIL